MKETLGCDLFSRVGACGRRPSESADPGVRRAGVIGTGSNAGLGLGKLYGGRGLGTKVATRCQFWCAESVVLWWENGGSRYVDASWSKRVSQRLTEPPAELHGAHLGSSGRAFGAIRETIFGGKSVRRRPSCPGSDVLGLKSGARKFSDWRIWIGPKK